MDVLENLMEMALLENKVDFVSLFMDNGIQLRNFLSIKRLLSLYNTERVRSSAWLVYLESIKIIFFFFKDIFKWFNWKIFEITKI